jgi:hypothetical protein
MRILDLSITTPALLFPAISLLLLAYNNRFSALAALIRELHAAYRKSKDGLIAAQIENLRIRVRLIQNMQALGILSFLSCTLSMLFLYVEWTQLGRSCFFVALLLLTASLFVSAREIQISTNALTLLLRDLQDP